MNTYAYYNGRFGLKEEINIPLTDRTLFFGDAVYDVAVGHNKKILWIEEHLGRLLEGAKAVGIEHGYSIKNLLSITLDVIGRSQIHDYLLYIQISRSQQDRKHSGLNCKANLLLMVSPFNINLDLPPMKLITVEDKRYGFCNIKTVNLLPAVMASTTAEKNGFDEAVFIRNGYVTECAKSNISILNRGRLITHPKSERILPGITREHLLRCCKEINIPITERPFGEEEMLKADEILVTSSTKLIRRVDYVNRAPVGGKAVTLFNKIRYELNKEFINNIQM